MGTLRIAYAPDSEDAFRYFAWQEGKVELSGHRTTFERAPLRILNQRADDEQYDLVTISAAFYPMLAGRYSILSTGTGVRRGRGPVLVAAKRLSHQHLIGRTVAVGGEPTTGCCLARMFCPGIRIVTLPSERIGEAVKNGDVAAGVMVSEEIINYPNLGLHEVLDLGKAWENETGLPLPVRLNLIRKDVAPELASRAATLCHQSLKWALENPAPAYEFACQFGRGLARELSSFFSWEDTLEMAADVRKALPVLYEHLHRLGMMPKLFGMEIVGPEA